MGWNQETILFFWFHCVSNLPNWPSLPWLWIILWERACSFPNYLWLISWLIFLHSWAWMSLRNLQLCRKSRLPKSTYNVTPLIYHLQTHKQFYKLLSDLYTCWESIKNCKGTRSLWSPLAKDGGVCTCLWRSPPGPQPYDYCFICLGYLMHYIMIF